MALVPKIDPNKIFASNAPTQDKPAAFDNYEKGMDETRKNLGRPTIKQLNYLHQTADQKILWIHQNGGGLPYDPSIEYAENAVTLKDGELKQLADGAWVEVKTKALPATAITTASSQNQQEINDFGGAKWYAKSGGYKLGATVKLANGDTVQSTTAANTVNPNVDMTGWENPADKQRKINDRILYFADYIDVMNGIVSNNSDFVTALTEASGRKIYIQYGEIIRLTNDLDLGGLDVNIAGSGKIIIDHAGQGFKTSGNVSISGDIEFDGNNKSWNAIEASRNELRCLVINGGVKFKNFYSLDFTHVVRSACSLNVCDGWSFENIRALGNGIIGDAKGVARAFYFYGNTYTNIKNGKVNGVHTVDSNGNILSEDADAIAYANGKHYAEIGSINFKNVGKRWVKFDSTADAYCSIKNIDGVSPFTATSDTAEALNNAMYSPVSFYAGTLDIDGLTLSGGACFACVAIGIANVNKVTLSNINYTPEYHRYANGLETRFILSDGTATNAGLTVGSGCSSINTYLGIEVNAMTPYLKIQGANITSSFSAITGLAKEIHINDSSITRVGAIAGGVAIIISTATEVVNIKNNNIVGPFQDGITIVGGRTKELYGSISGNTANDVTRSTLQNNEGIFASKITIGANFGVGTIVNNAIATNHVFRNKTGVELLNLNDNGLRFAFESASTATISSKTTLFNTVNKRAGRVVWNSTTNKLMIATGSTDVASWVSADGATTITPT